MRSGLDIAIKPSDIRLDDRVAVVTGGGAGRDALGQTIHVDGGTQAAGGWYHHPDTGEYKFGPGQLVIPPLGGLLVECAVNALEPASD